MNELINQMIAKQKALNVIESCENSDHYKGAEKYIELYNIRFCDFLGYNELKRNLQRVKVESLTPSR